MSRALLLDTSVDITTLNEIVDLDRYPIHEPESSVIKDLIAKSREELDTVGCCCIPNFIRADSIERMRAEIERKRPEIYWSQGSHTPYMTKDDPSLPADHPKRFFQKRSSGFVNSDLLEADSDLRKLYARDELLHFVAQCLGTTRPIHRWADPLGCSPYSVMDEGDYFPWHFDGNEFTVSILVQKAEKGGVFEYCPDLRTPENEHFDEVEKVLKGDRGPVHTLDLTPGDMQIFKGRFSMHRVTRVEGRQSRYIALPTYVYDPESVNRPERAKQFYGRAEPIHYEREAKRPDVLTD